MQSQWQCASIVDIHTSCHTLKGRLARQIWSQNVPEHVFVFFQILFPKHVYFSSKSVFLWYTFDLYANKDIIWILVCLFLSCGRSFCWKTLHFIPWLQGLSTQNSVHVAYQNVQWLLTFKMGLGLTLRNPLQREVTVSNDPGIQL